MKVRYGQVAMLLIGIAVVSLLLSAVIGTPRREDEGLSVVASVYPMYTATQQVVGEAQGVTVSCLTPPTGGCMHDHQLTPQERAAAGRADVLIINGGGAEAFLEPLLPQLTATVVNTAEGAVEHHDHGHDGHAHTSEHCWLDPTVYALQVERICEALCAADPSQAAVYRCNAERYLAEIEVIEQEWTAVAASLAGRKAVLFHESMAYPAELLGLTVVGTLPIGEETGFSAADVAAVTDAVRGQTVVLLYDEQYPLQLTQLADEAAQGAVVTLGSATSPVAGVADAQVWLHTMRNNLQRLKEAAV